MAAKTSGVFRELPLFRFDEVEEWQTYRVPGEATCDASAAAAAISAAGQGTSTAAASLATATTARYWCMAASGTQLVVG